jgi:hypothetical protein
MCAYYTSAVYFAASPHCMIDRRCTDAPPCSGRFSHTSGSYRMFQVGHRGVATFANQVPTNCVRPWIGCRLHKPPRYRNGVSRRRTDYMHSRSTRFRRVPSTLVNQLETKSQTPCLEVSFQWPSMSGCIPSHVRVEPCPRCVGHLLERVCPGYSLGRVKVRPSLTCGWYIIEDLRQTAPLGRLRRNRYYAPHFLRGMLTDFASISCNLALVVMDHSKGRPRRDPDDVQPNDQKRDAFRSILIHVSVTVQSF